MGRVSIHANHLIWFEVGRVEFDARAGHRIQAHGTQMYALSTRGGPLSVPLHQFRPRYEQNKLPYSTRIGGIAQPGGGGGTIRSHDSSS